MPLDPEEFETLDVPYNEIDSNKWNLPYSFEDQQADETWKRGFQAVFQRETSIGAMQRKTDWEFDVQSTPEEEAAWLNGEWVASNYLLPNSPLKADRYASDVSRVQNIRELAQLEGRAIGEAKNTSIVYEMGLAKSGVLLVAAGLPDPVTLPLLFYSPVVRGASAGTRILKLGLYGGVDQGLREAMIQPNQMGRSWQETALNVGTGTLLSGALGGALGFRMTPDINKRTARVYDEYLNGEDSFAAAFEHNVPARIVHDDPKIADYPRPFDPLERNGTIGMYTRPNQKITPDTIDEVISIDPVKSADIKNKLMLNEVAYKEKAVDSTEYYKIKNTLLADKVILQREALELRNEPTIKALTFGGRFTSQQSLAMSPSPTARTFAIHGLEVPYTYKNFDHSDVGGWSALTEQFKGHLNSAILFRGVYSDIYKKYGKAEGLPRVKVWLGDKFGSEEFFVRAKRALYSGDKDADNVLFTDLATGYRKEINKIVKPMVENGQIPGDPKTGKVDTSLLEDESWFPIVHDQRAMTGNIDEWATDVSKGWRVTAARDTEKIAKKRKDMEIETPELVKVARDDWNKVESVKGKKLVADRKANLEKEALQNYHNRLKEIDKIANKGKKSENQKSSYIARELPKAQERLTTTRAKNEDVLKSFAKKVNAERAVRRKEFVAKFEKERTATINKTIKEEEKNTFVHMNDMDDQALHTQAYKVGKEIEKIGTNEPVIDQDIIDIMQKSNSPLQFNATPSFLKHRNLRVPQEYLERWTLSNVVSAMDTFSRRGHGLNAMTRRFGTPDPTALVNRMLDDFDALLNDPRISQKERTKLTKQRDKSKDLMKHTWTALLGKNPDYSGASRNVRDFISVIRGSETMQHLGLTGFAAMEDLAAIPLHIGLKPIKGAVDSFVSKSDIHNMTMNTMKDVNIAAEAMIADIALSRVAGENLATTSEFAAKMHVVVTEFLKTTGMPKIDELTKGLVGYAMISRISRAAVERTPMDASDIALMNKFGLNQVELDRIIAQMRKYAKQPDPDNGYLHNADLWDDKHAAMTLDMAISRISRQVISTPNIGNQHKIMSHAGFGTLLQFKSHMIGTTDNHFIPAVQAGISGTAEQKLNIMMYGAAGFMLTGLTYNIRAALAGREPDNSTGNMVRQFITRTGGMGAWGMVMGVTDEQLGVSRAILGEEGQFFRQRSVWDGILGPAPSSLNDAFQVGSMLPSALSGEGINRGQIAAGRRLMFFQNHWAAIKPFNVLQESLEGSIGE